MFALLWELHCGKDHKTKKLIARNVRAWSHSLFEVFISMSRIFSKWKKVNKCSPKQMMGESRWHNTKPKEQCITILHTRRARDVLNFMFPFLWELFCGKDHKTKKLIARNLKAWCHSLFECQSCTLKQPDTFSVLCFLYYGSCSVAKTIKPKN